MLILLLSKYCIVEWVHATLICTQGPVLMQVIQDAVTWASAGDFQNRATATVTWTATSMETAAVTLGRRVQTRHVWQPYLYCISVEYNIVWYCHEKYCMHSPMLTTCTCIRVN